MKCREVNCPVSALSCGKVPDGWTTSYIIPILKVKKGDLSKLGNYRSISHAQVAKKIFQTAPLKSLLFSC